MELTPLDLFGEGSCFKLETGPDGEARIMMEFHPDDLKFWYAEIKPPIE